MKKTLILGLTVLILSLAVISCGKEDEEKTYSVYGVGVSQTEWNSFSMLGSGLAPSALINKSLTASEVNEAFTLLAADSEGTQLSNQTEAQLRTLSSGFGFDSDVDVIINKLKQQGWVLYATTQTKDSGDYADIIGIR